MTSPQRPGCVRRRSRPAARGRPCGARAGSGAGWRGSVRSQSMSRGRGRRVRAARSSAPVTACTGRLARRCSRSSTTSRTTAPGRLPGRARGSRGPAPSRVATRWTSGSTALQHLGLEQQLRAGRADRWRRAASPARRWSGSSGGCRPASGRPAAPRPPSPPRARAASPYSACEGARRGARRRRSARASPPSPPIPPAVSSAASAEHQPPAGQPIVGTSPRAPRTILESLVGRPLEPRADAATRRAPRGRGRSRSRPLRRVAAPRPRRGTAEARDLLAELAALGRARSRRTSAAAAAARRRSASSARRRPRRRRSQQLARRAAGASPLPPRNPSIQAAACAAGAPTGQLAGSAGLRPRPVEAPGVEQQSVGPPGDEPVHAALAVRDGLRQRSPARACAARRSSEQSRWPGCITVDPRRRIAAAAVVVERRARAAAARRSGPAAPGAEHDCADARRVRAANVAVADRCGPAARRRQHEASDVVLPGRSARRARHDRAAARPAGRRAGSARASSPELGEVARIRRRVGDLRRRGGRHGGAARRASITATASSGAHASCQVSWNVPVRAARRRPRCPRRRRAGRSRCSSSRPGQLALAAKVEVERRGGRGRLEPEPLAAGARGRRPAAPSACRRAPRRARSPTTSRVGDQPQRHARTRRRARPRPRRPARPGRPTGRPRSAASARGEPRRPRPHRTPASASGRSARSHAGDPDQPAGARRRSRAVSRGPVLEQVVVPAGRRDPGAVAAARGQPPMGPRHPGGGDLRPWAALEQGGVAGAGREASRRASAGACQAPQTTAIRSCAVALTAARIAARMGASRRAFSTTSGSSSAAASLLARTAAIASSTAAKRSSAEVAAVLDDVLPPPLGVVVAGRLGQRPSGSRARGRLARAEAPPSSARPARPAQLVPHGQVDEAHRHARARAPSASPATPARTPRTGRTPPARRRRPRRRAAPPAAACPASRQQRRPPGRARRRPRSARRRAAARRGRGPRTGPNPGRGGGSRAG